jgi:hypothetical protein
MIRPLDGWRFAPSPERGTVGDMHNGRIEISRDLDGHAVVLACLDLTGEEARGAAHVMGAVRRERYGMTELGTDDVLAMRELTALTDELGHVGEGHAISLVLKPARLSALRDALDAFVTERDEAEWLREEDREPLSIARALLWPVGDLSAEAVRAALSGHDSQTAG